MKAKAPFNAFDFFVFRTPLLPIKEFITWSEGLEAMPVVESPATHSSGTDFSPPPASDHEDASLIQALDHDRKYLRERLKMILSRPEVSEALFVASPNIIERFHLWIDDPDSERGRKVEHVLVRYFSRMAGRATPFGLFAGVSTGVIGDQTNLAIAGREHYRRHSRLDMDYLYALTDAITRDPNLRSGLKFYPNSSLYRAAGRARYVESRLKEKERLYHLVAVEETDYLAATLQQAAAGASPAELAMALVDDEVSLPDAREYIAELIDSQILVPAIALNVSGPEPLHPLIEQLRTTNETAEIAEVLQRTHTELESIDHDGLGIASERYRSIARALEPLPAKVELTRLFQVDMTKPAPEATLGREVLEEIERGVEILHGLSARPPRGGELALFREAFARRYEDREVPLVEALDEEIGVGFGNSEESSPLLKDLDFPPMPEEAQIDSARHGFMLSKLCESLSQGTHEIHLEPAELETITTKDRRPLPNSFAVDVTVAARSSAALAAGDFRVVIGPGSGPSGAILLGRFCHADASLEERVRAMLQDEESRQPEAIFAEIVHLPEGRLGNVISRPRMREYEIPYLARSVAAKEYQIPVSDLLVSVKGEHVLLRSARLQREVIPRLTNAHNFSWQGLGIYKFLCSLQFQRTAVLPGWDWGALAAAPFLPRVCAGRLVLSLARWRLDKKVLSELLKVKRAARFRAVQQIRHQRNLPRFLALADSDNILPVDLDNVLSTDSLTQLIKDREAAVLIELFPGPDELCATGPEGSFVHELIVPFVKSKDEGGRMKDEVTQTPADKPSSFIPHPSSFVRSFPPGSEWLYAKLYCGSATADVLLRDLVLEMVDAIKAAQAANLWFFIRYGDPDWHLRLRFHGAPSALQQTVLPLIHEKTAPFMTSGQIWRVQLDTYEREVERYGGAAGIELAEQLFHVDSEAVLQLIESLEPGDAGADERWRLTVYGIDRLLADFGFDLTMRHSILKQTRDVFAKEFRVEKHLWSQLSDRFRKERGELQTLLDASPDSDHPLAPGFEILHQRSRALAGIVSELQSCERKGDFLVPLPNLMQNFIHMHANRLLRSAQRNQELVIYDLLARFYESQLKRNSG